MATKQEITLWFETLQDNICEQLELADGQARFLQDVWERPGGGGGRSRLITSGAIIEKGGVNFSAVEGRLPEQIIQALGVREADFFATGISIVIHPHSPMQPIIHMNTRYFELSDGTCWFGGGIDLTPIYIVAEQAGYFHQQLRQVCEKHEPDSYAAYKKWADNYFFIEHRNETRGIGGIFFDRLAPNDTKSKENIFEFVKDVGRLFGPVYTHLLNQNKDKTWGEAEKQWQALRRGRYVEFNLVYDKGTKFGLQTQGRTESILMSMPPVAQWIYDFRPVLSSEEDKTQQWLHKDMNWADGL